MNGRGIEPSGSAGVRWPALLDPISQLVFFPSRNSPLTRHSLDCFDYNSKGGRATRVKSLQWCIVLFSFLSLLADEYFCSGAPSSCPGRLLRANGKVFLFCESRGKENPPPTAFSSISSHQKRDARLECCYIVRAHSSRGLSFLLVCSAGNNYDRGRLEYGWKNPVTDKAANGPLIELHWLMVV